MAGHQDSIEIKGRQVTLKVNGVVSTKVPLATLVKALQGSGDLELFPGILPEGVKYVARRGRFTVVVIEQLAMARTVFVPLQDSPTSEKCAVESVRRWLSFPYLYLLILFHGPALANCQQAFYRTEPLTSLDDKLYCCNLPNVGAPGERVRLRYWLCLQNMRDVRRLPWPDKIVNIVSYLWQSGWNWDFERHELQSMFSYYRQCNFDKRVCSFKLWETETKKDPLFTLRVKWEPTNLTVSTAIEELFKCVTPRMDINDCQDLVSLLVCRQQYEILGLF